MQNNDVRFSLLNSNNSYATPYFASYLNESKWIASYLDFAQFVFLEENLSFNIPNNFKMGNDNPFYKLSKVNDNLIALVNSRCSMYSKNNGLNWDSIKFNDDVKPNIYDFIEKDNSLIGVNGKNYLLISNDNGVSWSKFKELDSNIYTIANGRNDDILVFTRSKIYRLDNNFILTELAKDNTNDHPLRINYNEKNNILFTYGYYPDEAFANINKSTDYGKTWTKFELEMGREIPPFNMTLDNNGNFYIIDINKMYILHKDRFLLDTFQLTNKIVTFIDYNYYNENQKGVVIGAADGIYLLDYVSSVNNEGEIKLKLLTYPNPSKDNIRVDIENINTVFAIDLIGIKTKLNFEENNIDISTLVKGYYQLIIEDNTGKISISKFIKD